MMETTHHHFSGLAFSAHMSLQVAGHHLFILRSHNSAPQYYIYIYIFLFNMLHFRNKNITTSNLFQFFTQITLEAWTK